MSTSPDDVHDLSAARKEIARLREALSTANGLVHDQKEMLQAIVDNKPMAYLLEFGMTASQLLSCSRGLSRERDQSLI